MPVDEDGRDGADQIPASELANYSSIYWFNPSSGQLAQSGFSAKGGETVFWTPVNGNGKSGGSDFPRTEMREQLELGNSRANWRLTGTHIQRGTVAITRMPTPLTAGRTTFVFFAQMHSVDNAPPVKLVFQRAPDGTTSVHGNYNLSQRAGNAVDSDVELPMPIGKKFTYEIKVVDGTVTTTINDTVIDRRNLRPAWLLQEFYFKAGSYLGNNTSTATGFAEVVYYAIERVHR